MEARELRDGEVELGVDAAVDESLLEQAVAARAPNRFVRRRGVSVVSEGVSPERLSYEREVVPVVEVAGVLA